MPTPAELTINNLPVVVLIGRANVGKSTLFNKLIEEQKAIVSTIAGTTRTNNEGDVLWRGKYIHLIDTGGQDSLENERFADEIYSQAEEALDSADIIIMVVDGQVGVLPQERDLARRLQKRAHKQGSELMLIANKVDNARIEKKLGNPEWLKLALGKPYGLSGASGRGVGDFLDILMKQANKRSVRPKKKKHIDRNDMVRVSLIGKPNAGKSSLFNKLIGQDKVIVSDVAHTTREPFDTQTVYEDPQGTKHNITFVDTAGIRRKAKVKGVLERFGIRKSIESVDNSDVVLLVLDGTEPISSQDLQLGGLVEKRSKSVIILLNKWDMAEDNSQAQRTVVEQNIRSMFPHLDFAPILFVSGKTGYRVHEIFPLITHAMQARKTQIPERVLEKFIEDIQKIHRPSRGKGTRHPKIRGFKQVHTNPPIFDLYIKYKTSIHRSYVHFIENKLREQFDFTAVPIVIKMTKIRR